MRSIDGYKAPSRRIRLRLSSGRRIKLRYMTQANARPPTFVLFCSRPKALPESYSRYLVNSLAREFRHAGRADQAQSAQGRQSLCLRQGVMSERGQHGSLFLSSGAALARTDVLPTLLELSLKRGWRAVVQAASEERVEALEHAALDLSRGKLPAARHGARWARRRRIRSISPRATTIPMRRKSAFWSMARRSPMPRLTPASPLCSTAAMRKRWRGARRVAGGEGARPCRQLLAAGCRRALAAKGVIVLRSRSGQERRCRRGAFRFSLSINPIFAPFALWLSCAAAISRKFQLLRGTFCYGQ